MTDPAPRFDAQPNVGNHFAWLRTEMALQRTVLAAARTGVSLIGFGFTVAQFFQKILKDVPDHVRHVGPDTPRNLGLVLIAAGVICVATFTFQYYQATTYLRSGDYKAIAGAREASPRTSTYLVCGVIIAIGVAAFGSVFMRF